MKIVSITLTVGLSLSAVNLSASEMAPAARGMIVYCPASPARGLDGVRANSRTCSGRTRVPNASMVRAKAGWRAGRIQRKAPGTRKASAAPASTASRIAAITTGTADTGTGRALHEDAVATAALGRLDHAAVALGHDLRESAHLALVCDDAVQVGNGHTGSSREFLGQGLVIDARIEAPRVETHDVIGIALVQAEQTCFAQLSSRARRHHLTSGPKRRSSVSR